tara:strand:- start:4215 stop:4766 length:552 start_codon:yes stop_codon:yes gene_type:complete
MHSKDDVRKNLLLMMKDLCYKKGEFKLSSGKTSEHYINCKPVTLSSWGLSLVCPLMVEHLEEDTKSVGGLTLGADPLVAGVALAALLQEKPIDAMIVRKEPKGHGTGAWIEGPVKPAGSKITVLEDVITTGGSVLKAVEKLRDAGYTVQRVVSIVDRKEHDPFTFLDAGLELVSLFTIEDFNE